MTFEQTLVTVIGSIIGAVLLAVTGIITARITGRVQRRAADTSDRSVDVAEWQAILAELRAEVKRLDDRVGALETALDLERKLRRAAISYARQLHAFIRRYVPDREPPAVPELLRDDLP